MRALVLVGLFLLQTWIATPSNAEQSTKVPRVAVLLASFPVESPEARQFQQGLRTLGYVEGQDVLIDWRSTEGNYSRLPAAVAETLKGNP